MLRLIIGIVGYFLAIFLYAQEDSVQFPSGDFPLIIADTIVGLPVVSDSISLPTSDSTMLAADSLGLMDSTTIPPVPQGDITTTINYNARDSIHFDMRSQRLKMYGKTHIDYGNIQLDAETTEVSLDDRTINSTYSRDSTGRKVGKPVFTEGSDIYETDHILYNFNTQRAQIKGVVTEQQGAYMHGADVKKNEQNEMFIRGAAYTTCNQAEPHFHIVSDKLKVTKRNVISGPFNLRFREVITPLWFPFGMFPQPRRRTSGIIFPSYGEETRRGFFLRDGGYYWSISDYVDLRMTGDFYSKGGYAINTTSNYRMRYKFSGNLNFSYNRNISDDIDNPINSNDFWVRWSHRPETRGNSSFSASVSAGTTTYSRNNNIVNQNFNQSINSQFSSNVSYSQRFPGTPFNLSMNARHNQNIASGVMNLSLPELTFNMSRIYPLKKLNARSDFINKLGFSYNFVAKNELTNSARGSFPFDVANEDPNADEVIPFTAENWDEILARAKTGGRHQIPINTTIGLFKGITLNPSFNFQEYWYPYELDYTYIESDSAVRVDTLHQFSRAGSWRSGASLNTIIYGTKFFKSDGYIQAIRHVMTPSLSFTYNPDFGDPSKGVYKWVQKNPQGDSVLVSKYNGFAYGSPTGQESRSVGFSLQNNLEMKVRDKEDTTGTGYKKVKLFENLSLSSSYNFAADSFRLSKINWSTRTSFFQNKLGLAFRGTIDPYVYELISESETPTGDRIVRQRKVDRYAWHNGEGIGSLESFSTAVSLNLRPSNKGNNRNTDDQQTDPLQQPRDPLNRRADGLDENNNLTLEEEEQLDYIRQNPNEYVDFSIPWDLSVSYNINFTKRGFEDGTIRQTLTFRGGLSLTPKTKIRVTSGFDLEANQFTQTRITISRDLHCWALSFNWVPFGRYQSFGIVLQPKSSLLQDLKLQRRGSFYDTNY